MEAVCSLPSTAKRLAAPPLALTLKPTKSQAHARSSA
jgi:hypothetical protein